MSRIRCIRETFESLLRLRPDDVKALRNLAFCYRRLGNEERAQEFLRRTEGNGAVEESPDGDDRPPPREGEEGSPSPPEATPLEAWIAEAALPLHGRGGEIFHSSPGSAVCCVDEKIFLKKRHLFSYRGVIVFSSASREARNNMVLAISSGAPRCPWGMH